jgi:hypothetical protein
MLGKSWELFPFLIACSIFAVPGVFAVSRLFPQKSIVERWILGSTMGLAAAVYLAFSLAYFNLAFFYPAWLVAALVSVRAWLQQRTHIPLFEKPRGNAWMLVVVLLLVATTRFGISLLHDLPPGFDPSFHLILVKKLATTGKMVFDWKPFEDISLNYPLGSHVLVAVIAQIAHLPLHTIFKLLIPAVGVLSTAQVYLFAEKITTRTEVAIFSALAYGLWAVYGSIDYYRWGGLPNLLAMAFFMAFLTLLADTHLSKVHSAILALLFVSIFFTHHHVMITCGLVLCALFIFHFFKCRNDRKHLAIFQAMSGGTLLGCFYIVPYLSKALTIGNTEVLTFSEPFYNLALISSSLGVVFLILSVVGILVHVRAKVNPLGSFYVISCSLMTLFIFCEYAYRLISMHVYGRSYVAFTPSRFLTDLVYFMSIFAGYALFQLQRWLRIPMVLAFGICLTLSLTNYRLWNAMRAPTFPRDRLESFQWIEKNTPPKTLVMNEDRWAVYATWRRCMLTPVPISEPSRKNTRKASIFEALKAGRILPEIAGTMVVGVIPLTEKPQPWPVLWRHSSGLAVVEVWHGQALHPEHR